MCVSTYVVAPLVGAWIEIHYARVIFYNRLLVAPLVGAWIEMGNLYY